jgi:hypothetical protein
MNKESHDEDYISVALKELSFTYKDTVKNENERYKLWREWIVVHVYIYNSFENLLEEPKFKSLLLVRLLELKKQLRWIENCVLFGAYYSAIRELRFFFESFVQAYYLDTEHLGSGLKCKLEIIKEIDKQRIFVSKLIDGTNLSENKDKLKRLYSELSSYSHSSYKKIKDEKIIQSVAFTYDKELFDKCFCLTNEVMDAIIFIIMSFKSEMIKEIQRNGKVMELVEKNDCKLSLSLIGKK